MGADRPLHQIVLFVSVRMGTVRPHHRIVLFVSVRMGADRSIHRIHCLPSPGTLPPQHAFALHARSCHALRFDASFHRVSILSWHLKRLFKKWTMSCPNSFEKCFYDTKNLIIECSLAPAEELFVEIYWTLTNLLKWLLFSNQNWLGEWNMATVIPR